MKQIGVPLITLVVVLGALPPRAHAIIILPAVALIPLAKLIAVIVGTLSIPAASLGTMVGIFTKNRKLGISVTLIVITVLTVAVAYFLRVKNPHNPWY